MNKEFLEFFGNFLVDVARGQKQVEQIWKWISSDFKGFEDLNREFKKFYGLDKLSESDPEYRSMWEKSISDFRKAFKEYLELFDVVPKEKYEKVVKECEKLKEKVKQQDERISQLETLLRGKGIEYGNFATEFQKLMEKQTREFRKVLEAFAAPLSKTDPEKANK